MNAQDILSISDEHNKNDIEFNLHDFLPYQVRVFYNDVSMSIANIYSKEHKLSKSDWRTMVNLWPDNSLSARNIVDVSSMDKVSVSRAVARMTKRKLLNQEKDEKDGRVVLLTLSEQGKLICDDIIRKAQKVEAKMIEGFSPEEQQQLSSLMQRVRDNLK